MTNNSNSISSEQIHHDEFVIAGFGQFQIAVASGLRLVSRKIFSVSISLPSRYYSVKGSLIWNGQPDFNLSGLQLSNLFQETTSFPSLKRLSAGIPLSFEVRSDKPLPQELKQLATFTCQVPEAASSYNAVFRNIVPQFVQIVPNQDEFPLAQQIKIYLQKKKHIHFN